MRNSPAIFVSLFVIAAMLQTSVVYAATPSPLASLSDAEKTYYEKSFDYSMEVIKAGEKYKWASYGGKGEITIGEAFVSKSGATCRPFSETFTVRGQDGIDKGYGCKRRGPEGWCKLDVGKESKSCSFEDTWRMFGGISISAPNLSMPGGTAPISGPDISGPNTNINTNINTDTGYHEKPNLTGKSYADTVTGQAGQAAGNAASSGITWFTSTFLR